MKNKKYLFPLNLQMFAEGDNGEEGATTQTEPNANTDENKGDTPKVKTFTQEEMDNIIKGRLARERKAWEKELTEKQTEAERLAKMTDDEKRSYQSKKREKELDEREAAINKRELMAEAKATLEGKGLPQTLADLLDYSSAEACNESINKVSAAFQSAVETSVTDRIKGGKPITKVPSNSTLTLESIKSMSAEEINRNWDQVQEVMKSSKKG